jgi:hypothetical protein
MPRGRKAISGPLVSLANNRSRLEKNRPEVSDLILRELGREVFHSTHKETCPFRSELTSRLAEGTLQAGRVVVGKFRSSVHVTASTDRSKLSVMSMSIPVR